MFERVLVPLDGSGFAEFALSPGVEIARRAGAHLELLTVIDPLPAIPNGMDVGTALEQGALRYLETRRDEVVARLGEDRVDVLVHRGSVAERIEARAREAGADLVVVASHGRGPLSRFWLGSVADELIRHAPCPVLVIRPREDDEPRFDEEFRAERILVPVDRTEVSTVVVERAVELGRLFDARFRLVNSISYPSEEFHPYLTQASRMDDQWLKETMEEGRRRLETVADRMRSRGFDVDVSVGRAESAAERILDEARDWDADVIAMATHGRGGVPRTVLGSVADKVVRASSLPVFITRPDGSESAE